MLDTKNVKEEVKQLTLYRNRIELEVDQYHYELSIVKDKRDICKKNDLSLKIYIRTETMKDIDLYLEWLAEDDRDKLQSL